MNGKRLAAILLSFIMVFSLTACRDGGEADISQESTTYSAGDENGSAVSDDIPVITTVLTPEASETVADMTEENTDDPALWTRAQVVEFYKKAAVKSNSTAKSNQGIELKKISVNNGEYEGLFDFIMPIMSKLLANNSKENDGITGGFNNLSESDVASAKAYRSGNNIAVEMVMREQTAGASDDANSGTVGHAITAVGDIGVVINQLKDLGLPLEISEKDTKIYYTKPVVKVLINGNGEIVNGTWRYTVEISMNNYKAFGKAVETTSVVMDNVITVNGGFKK